MFRFVAIVQIVLSLGAVTQVGAEEQVVPHFIDVSYQTGVCRARDLEPYGPLWAELNNDGFVDLVFMNHGAAPSVFVNQSGQAFWDQFPWSGIGMAVGYEEQNDRHGCAAGDFDNDGLVDLFISHGAHRGRSLGTKRDELLRNEGDLVFADLTEAAGVSNSAGRGRSGHWLDFNNDGWLDLHVENFKTANRLYLNHGDGTFGDATVQARLPAGSDVSLWTDFDHDGWLDHLMAPPLRLFRNDRGARLMEAAGAGPDVLVAPRSAVCGDFDNDGWNDVFFTSNRAGGNRLLRNTGHGFTPVAGDFGTDDNLADGTAAWGDLDNDGDLDLVVTSTSGLRYFENQGGLMNGRALELDPEIAPGAGADIALTDYDGDGALDIALHGTRRQYLLRNQTTGQRWLEIHLTGTASNRSAFGAIVWVMNGAHLLAYREYMGDTSSGLAHGCAPVHVGLGQVSQVLVRVRWPSGKETILPDVAADQVIRLTEE